MVSHMLEKVFPVPALGECVLRGVRELHWQGRDTQNTRTTKMIRVTHTRLDRHDSRPVTWNFPVDQQTLNEVDDAIRELPERDSASGGEHSTKYSFVDVSPWLRIGVRHRGIERPSYLEFKKGEHRIRAVLQDGGLADFREMLSKVENGSYS